MCTVFVYIMMLMYIHVYCTCTSSLHYLYYYKAHQCTLNNHIQYIQSEEIILFDVMIFTLLYLHRYLYFLQLKELILDGQLECSNDLAVKLASYALQGIALD